MAKYKLYTYDVLGNNKDGFEVNDVYSTSYIVELPRQNPTDEEIVKGLKLCGWMKKGIHTKSVEIDGDGDSTLYVNNARNGKPECELRLID